MMKRFHKSNNGNNTIRLLQGSWRQKSLQSLNQQQQQQLHHRYTPHHHHHRFFSSLYQHQQQQQQSISSFIHQNFDLHPLLKGSRRRLQQQDINQQQQQEKVNSSSSSSSNSSSSDAAAADAAVTGIAGMKNVYLPEHFPILAQHVKQNIYFLCELIASYNNNDQQQQQQQVRAITTQDAVIIIDTVDEISNQLCLSLDFMELVRCIHPDPVIRDAAQNSQMDVSLLLHELNNDSTIHSVLKRVEQGSVVDSLTELQRHCLAVLAKDMERYGSVGKESHDSTKDKLIELSSIIDRYVHQYGDYVTKQKAMISSSSFLPIQVSASDPIVQEMLQKYPMMLKKQRMKSGGEEKVFVHSHSLHNNSSSMRKLGYIALFSADPKALDALEHLLTARHELAQTLNKPSYAHHHLSSFMVGTPEKAQKFLQDLSDQIRPKAEEEIELLRQEKILTEGNRNIYAWDIDTYKRLYESKQKIDNASLAQIGNYLHYENCIHGISTICEKLFRLRIERAPLGKYETWSDKIIKMQIFDTAGTGEFLGDIYLDIFSQEHKIVDNGNFCRQLAKTSINQKPVSVIALNLKSEFLSLSELVSLFHEVGHAMHVILGQTPYQNLSGTRVSIDWAEMPSQFMEHFATDYRVVSQFARHYKTGEVLPENLFQYYSRKKNMFKAIDVQDQIVYAMLDLVLHMNKHKELGLTTTQMLYKIRQAYHSVPITENDSIDKHYPISYHGNLLHLTNYASSYYAYLYSKISSDHLWYKYFAHLDDPVNANAAEALKRAMSYGGTKKEAHMLHELLEEEPSPAYFLREFQR